MAKFAIDLEGAEAMRELSVKIKEVMLDINQSSETLKAQIISLGDELGGYEADILSYVLRIDATMADNSDMILQLSDLVLRKSEEIYELLGLDEFDTLYRGGKNIGRNTASSMTNLSSEEVNLRWKKTIDFVDKQIDNYREALHDRNVPDCHWLEQLLSIHKEAMLQQEKYILDVASGKSSNIGDEQQYYNYPSDYDAFYNELSDQFINFCLEGTNPNYNKGAEWRNNCQRCVPAYELRRRGREVSATSSTHGGSHLTHYPFDAWELPTVCTTTGNGKSDIEKMMSLWGDGARAQVVVLWDDGSGVNGHTFIAEQRNGHTLFIDPQTNNSNVDDYFLDVVDGKTRFCRIDNLSMSKYSFDCYTEG